MSVDMNYFIFNLITNCVLGLCSTGRIFCPAGFPHYSVSLGACQTHLPHPKSISHSSLQVSWSFSSQRRESQCVSDRMTLPSPHSQCPDLICLVIWGLARSAQVQSKVKLDKGIGASPCKTVSPWQLADWAEDCLWRAPERSAHTNSI